MTVWASINGALRPQTRTRKRPGFRLFRVNFGLENVDLETTAKGEQLVIRARPWKSSQKSVAAFAERDVRVLTKGKVCADGGLPISAAVSRSSSRPRHREFAARSTALSCSRSPGRGTGPASQRTLKILRYGCRSICPEKPARSISFKSIISGFASFRTI